MDIHRSRFVPFNPSAINALAFSQATAQHSAHEPESLRLAIGRANGNIELWNPANGAWIQEKVFHGGKDRSVEGLTWIQEPGQERGHDETLPGRLRLFSIGYSSSVTEWDLATGLPLRHSDGNHSDIWCFAAQPRRRGLHQKIVAGCADGTIVLLATEDNHLIFERFVSRAANKKARALSITYKDNDVVLAGFADSTIRVFDTRNGSLIRTISLGSGPVGGPKEILVWKVMCLSDGHFVSGDSTGDIRIYNGKNFSQVQRISGHEADVLDLAVSQDGTSLFSAGMDRRTCLYTSRKGLAQGQSGKWRKVLHKRYHEHDVKALAIYEGNKLSVLVSGGIDTQPVTVPVREFGKELSRRLLVLPKELPLASAPDARLLLSWWATEIRIWRIKSHDEGAEKPRVVARLALQGEETITSVTISRDGTLLAAATASAVKIFQLAQMGTGAKAALRIRKLDAPTLPPGAKIVKLTANGDWLVTIAPNDDICLARIVRRTDVSGTPRVLGTTQRLRRLKRTFTLQNSLAGSSAAYERSIAYADFSMDGNVLATVDLAGYVDTWFVEGYEDTTAPEVDIDNSASAAKEDTDSDTDTDMDSGSDSDSESDRSGSGMTFFGQSWVGNPSGHLLPRLDSTPVLLSFPPTPNTSRRPPPNGNPTVHATRSNPHPRSHKIISQQSQLLVVSADHQLHLFDLHTGRLSDWSRRNPPAVYPHEYRQLDSSGKGCIWDVRGTEQRVWVYGEKWLFMFDLTKDLPISGQDAGHSRKRKREAARNHSGAGGAAPLRELPVTQVKKAQTGRGVDATWTDVNISHDAFSDDEADGTGESLLIHRRTMAAGGQPADDEGLKGVLEEDEVGGKELMATVDGQGDDESWWHTLKYRPILGIVAMGGGGVGIEDEDVPEVVLVERPVWDFDLPPRFVGMHEQ